MTTAAKVVVGLAVLLMVGTVAVAVLVMQGGGTRPAATATPAPADEEAAGRRLVLENYRADDAAREFMFRGALRKAGERCDSVERMIKRDLTWVVHCKPGYTYRFDFDARGDFVSARRL